jgi:hypothetical protein
MVAARVLRCSVVAIDAESGVTYRAASASSYARGAAGDLIPAFGVECASVVVKGTK